MNNSSNERIVCWTFSKFHYGYICISLFQTHEMNIPFFQVLFLKNLSTQVKEIDLVTIFDRFQSQSFDTQIVYRLMTGRMKGQAFVTFPGKYMEIVS